IAHEPSIAQRSWPFLAAIAWRPGRGMGLIRSTATRSRANPSVGRGLDPAVRRGRPDGTGVAHPLATLGRYSALSSLLRAETAGYLAAPIAAGGSDAVLRSPPGSRPNHPRLVRGAARPRADRGRADVPRRGGHGLHRLPPGHRRGGQPRRHDGLHLGGVQPEERRGPPPPGRPRLRRRPPPPP